MNKEGPLEIEVLDEKEYRLFHIENMIASLEEINSIIEEEAQSYQKVYNKMFHPNTFLANGERFWHDEQNHYHREDGPAYIAGFLGDQEWWWHGKKHRLDGPAVITREGNKEWWYYGTKLDCNNQEDYERLLKLKVYW